MHVAPRKRAVNAAKRCRRADAIAGVEMDSAGGVVRCCRDMTSSSVVVEVVRVCVV
jgi:hypothetical protein